MNEHSDWLSVTKDRPCPACGKPDWCAWAPDGKLKCNRTSIAPPGFEWVADKDGGAIFRPAEAPDTFRMALGAGERARAPLTSASNERPPRVDWGVEAAKLGAALDDDTRQRLADELGVSAESLSAVSVGRGPYAFTFPERDGSGAVIGIATRSDNGAKGFMRGGNRGLTVPGNLESLPDPVLIVEGASDVAACLTLGLAAVGRPSNSQGSEHLAGLLASRGLIVVGENDQKADGSWPGRDGAHIVAKALSQRLGRAIDCALPPETCKDIRGWLNDRVREGLSLQDDESRMTAGRRLLQHLRDGLTTIKHESDSGPLLTRLSDVKPECITWLWPDRFPLGKLSVLAGDPGLGKSFVTLDMAARVSKGEPWPDEPRVSRAPAGVVLVSAEDDPADTIRPRLDALGADASKIVLLEGIKQPGGKLVLPFTLEDVQALEDAIRKTPACALVVIDPIGAFMGEADAHRNNEVRALLAPLAKLAAQSRVAIVIVAHLNKSAGSKGTYRISGSLGLAAAARCVWIVAKDPGDSDQVVVVLAKSNLSSKKGGLAFRINGDPPRIEWSSDPVQLSDGDVLQTDSGESEDRSEVEECSGWLKEALSEGPVAAVELKRLAREAGYSDATLRRAKARSGVQSQRSGFGKGSKVAWVIPAAIEAQQPHSCSRSRD